MTKYRATYLITSERAYRRNDEIENTLHSNKILNVGDAIVLDGLTWYVDKIVCDPDRNIFEED